MDDVEPKRKWRKDLAFMISLIALLLAVAIAALAVSSAAGQTVERNARNRDRETILELETAQATVTETTGCIRLFGIHRDEARDARDTALADAIVIAVGGGDTAAPVKVYQAANDAFKVASDAYSDYVKAPVLPCPTP